MKKTVLLLLLFIGIQSIFAQKLDSINIDIQQFTIDDNLYYSYSKPKLLDMFKYIPSDLADLGKYLINKENLTSVVGATAATVVIIPFDEKLTQEASNLGSYINLDNEGTYLRIHDVRMFPKDLPASLYYLGNGGTTFLIGGGFFIMGKIKNDYRMLTTSSEIVEGFITTAIVTQTIKRITGRQSPVSGGDLEGSSKVWHPLPSFKKFENNKPYYDAMPSGHLATFMTTLTIIATNYPEVKWIKPVGYSMAGLLAFQMVSSRVHWTSDYPLAVLFGYAIGKNIANRKIEKIHKIRIGSKDVPYKSKLTLSSMDGYTTINCHISF